jgi:hypothetical protein
VTDTRLLFVARLFFVDYANARGLIRRVRVGSQAGLSHADATRTGFSCATARHDIVRNNLDGFSALVQCDCRVDLQKRHHRDHDSPRSFMAENGWQFDR